MSLNNVPSWKNLPGDFNVAIEIPMQGDPAKYGVAKNSGAIFVDRLMNTAMHYPCNCGYIPHSLSEDSDPVDVLVITPVPLLTGAVACCRPPAVLKMGDESGFDARVLAVPEDKLSTVYRGLHNFKELPGILLKQIAHFFEHNKDLEPHKWIKVKGWKGMEETRAEIMTGMENFRNAKVKQEFCSP